jgi:subtilisin family serine protease
MTSENTTNGSGNNNTTDMLSGENVSSQSGAIIPGEWIITLKENATIDAQSANSSIAALSDEAENSGIQVVQTLPEIGVLVIKTPPNQENSIQALADVQDNPNVLAVEPNTVVKVQEQRIPTGVDRIDAEPGLKTGSLGDNTTAVNSMDANTSQSVNSSAMNMTKPAVPDVDVGVIDTGIDLTHPDLNVVKDVTFVPGTTNGNDDNGHGTHVSGIIAAKDDGKGVVGVAPGAKLWAIKVLDASGSGSAASVLSGINYAIQNAKKLDVINLSLGGTHSVAEYNAINRAVNAGISVVVAAGNSHDDAINYSPASAPEAITVSALADSDGKCGGQGPSTTRGADESFATFSNYGDIVDIMAPGVNILSTWKDGGFNTISGTSMASPYVAGAAALYKSANPSATPEQVLDALSSIASKITTKCYPDSGHGYLVDRSQDLDDEAEPLLYAKNLGGKNN